VGANLPAAVGDRQRRSNRGATRGVLPRQRENAAFRARLRSTRTSESFRELTLGHFIDVRGRHPAPGPSSQAGFTTSSHSGQSANRPTSPSSFSYSINSHSLPSDRPHSGQIPSRDSVSDMGCRGNTGHRTGCAPTRWTGMPVQVGVPTRIPVQRPVPGQQLVAPPSCVPVKLEHYHAGRDVRSFETYRQISLASNSKEFNAVRSIPRSSFHFVTRTADSASRSSESDRKPRAGPRAGGLSPPRTSSVTTESPWWSRPERRRPRAVPGTPSIHGCDVPDTSDSGVILGRNPPQLWGVRERSPCFDTNIREDGAKTDEREERLSSSLPVPGSSSRRPFTSGHLTAMRGRSATSSSRGCRRTKSRARWRLADLRADRTARCRVLTGVATPLRALRGFEAGSGRYSACCTGGPRESDRRRT
jgi:hypothetical protein